MDSNIKNRFLGVVLAGGLSSRMGVDKKFIAYKGKNLLEHAIDLLASVVGGENVLISGFTYRDKPAVSDLIKNIGPIGGLASVIQSDNVSIDDKLLLIPVDMPGLTVGILKNLYFYMENSTLREAIGVQYHGRELPVAFRITDSVYETVSEMCLEQTPIRDRSLRNLWKLLNFHMLPNSTANDAFFKNINTQSEWQNFLRDNDEY
ncbi:MAG: molybdenum cofactor guanylyltransferase [Oligoflexia bacterium]|nr:molybdenum cofactor guanylyltransferase [Oligoflexia bacterium]